MIESARFNMDNLPDTWEGREFIECRFERCDFTGRSLSKAQFIECTFAECNLSNTKLTGTSFQKCGFISCKLLGVDFSPCSKFLLGFKFEDCMLDMAVLTDLPLKSTQFTGCSLKETDFSRADLSESVFKNCELTRAVFDRTDLKKADFRSARNYLIDPSKNNIRKAKFTWPGVMGLLWGFEIILSGSDEMTGG
jgi:fluoroquinolone resistance protein